MNAVSPGYTLSLGFVERIESGHRDVDAIKRTTALRSLIQPAQVAAAVQFLCSDEAAAITGINLPVDAGWLANVTYGAYPA